MIRRKLGQKSITQKSLKSVKFRVKLKLSQPDLCWTNIEPVINLRTCLHSRGEALVGKGG